ncbi:MAG TPA: mycothiol synthase, partial [Streptomyces sp.]|nr:mycothiol synthase [Streptomyces sp.]
MTTDSPLPSPGREIETLDALTSEQADAVLALL